MERSITKVSLTERDIATLLAALRNWQEIISEEGGNNPYELKPEYFDEIVPLDDDEIDDLCERINCGD